MDREQALKRLKEIANLNLYYELELDEEVFEVVSVAIKALEQTRWVPVSEKLPEEDGRYLAYIVNKHDDKYQYIMTCYYSVDGYWNWFPDDECASDNVIAWMPLPEPYTVEQQEISDRNLKMWEEIYAEEKRRESEG